MGIFSKLFGKKKTQETKVSALPSSKQAPKPAPEAPLAKPASTLEEVQADIRDGNIEGMPSNKKASTSQAEISEADAVESETTKYHIKKQGSEWDVITESSKKPLRTFATQKEAIEYAKKENLPHTVFKVDGTPK